MDCMYGTPLVCLQSFLRSLIAADVVGGRLGFGDHGAGRAGTHDRDDTSIRFRAPGAIHHPPFNSDSHLRLTTLSAPHITSILASLRLLLRVRSSPPAHFLPSTVTAHQRFSPLPSCHAICRISSSMTMRRRRVHCVSKSLTLTTSAFGPALAATR